MGNGNYITDRSPIDAYAYSVYLMRHNPDSGVTQDALDEMLIKVCNSIVAYDKIPLTKEWMMEFYRRHKGESCEMWKSRYDNYIAGLESRGWRTVNGRFMNPELGY